MKSARSKILVVESDRPTRAMISKMLSIRFFIEVSEVVFEREAICLLESQEFALIISDAGPSTNFELLSYWEEHADVAAPMIVFAERAQTQEICDRVAVIEKPNIDSLISVIDELDVFELRCP